MNTRIFAFFTLTGIFPFFSAVLEGAAQHPLESWARRDVRGLASALNAVAFGNGVFVAVGVNSTVARSTDGVNWTFGSAGSYGDFQGIRFLNGQFIVVGASTDKLLFSTNGTSWSEQTLPGLGSWDIAYGNGIYVAAGHNTYVSSNAVDWAIATPPRVFEGINPIAIDIALDAVAYGSGRFVGLPAGLNSVFQTPRPSFFSTNGLDWFEGALAPSAVYGGLGGDLVWANDVFVGTAFGNKGVATSIDGSSWQGAVGRDPTFFSATVAYGQGQFIFVRQPPTATKAAPIFYSSTDGITWASRLAIPQVVFSPSDPLIPYYDSMRGYARGGAFGNGTFVVVGIGADGQSPYIVQSGNLGGSPNIISQPQDRGAVVGNPASFAVQATGSPPLAYQWFHNGSSLANETNSSYSIAQVQASQVGGYQVVIANSFGSVTSRVAQLTVSFLNIKAYAGIEILGVPGRTYRVEATSASGPVSWQTLTHLVLPSSPHIWIDYESPAAAQRLYRAAELP